MKQQSETTVMTLANAMALTVAIVDRVSGTEVSETIGGQLVSRDALTDIVASRIGKNFSTYLAQTQN